MPSFCHPFWTAALFAALSGTAAAQTDLRPGQDDQQTNGDGLRTGSDTDPASDDGQPRDADGKTAAERMREPPPDLPQLDNATNTGEPTSVGDRYHQNNAPQGFQAGPWKVTPSATLRAGYNDNVTTVPTGDDKLSSVVINLRGRVDVTNENGPNALTAFAEIGQTWYTQASDLDHFDGSVGVGGNAQLSKYIRIRGALGFVSAAAEDTANNGVVVGGDFDPYVNLARYIAVPASIGASFDAGRWFVDADGSIVYSKYDDRTTQGGLTVDQAFQNGTVSDVKFRTGWRFTPGTALFAEVAYNLQRYNDKSANSDGWRAVGGAQFELSRLLTGDIFAGYASQRYDGGGSVNGFTYGAHLTWFASDLISVRLEARRDFGADRIVVLDDGSSVTAPVTRDNVGLKVEYEPLRQMLVTAEAGWGQDKYEGQDRTDERWYAGLGAEYAITPSIRFNLDYRYEETSSPIAGDSTNNVVYLGVTTGY